MGGAFAILDKFLCMGNLLRGEFAWTAQLHAAPLGRFPARFCPLLYQ